MKNLYFLWQMVQLNYQGENYEFQEPTLRRESTVRRENLSGESHGDREEFQPEETKDDEGVNKDFWAHAEARKDFLSHHIEPRSSVALAEKRIMSYSTEFFWCHQVNLCRSGDCSRKENLWQFGCQICQIRGRVSQDLRYWTKLLWKEMGNPGEEENWREFKRHHVQITYGLTHWQQFWKQLKEERNKNKWIEKLLFHAKDRVPEHAYGKPMFQNNKSRSVWSKIRLYWYCRRETEFSVVFTTWSRIRSNEKIWKKALHLVFFFKWKLARVVSSRDTAYLRDTILRETLKPGEYEILSSVILGRKRYKLRILFCSAILGCTHECGGCTPKEKWILGNRELRTV